MTFLFTPIILSPAQIALVMLLMLVIGALGAVAGVVGLALILPDHTRNTEMKR